MALTRKLFFTALAAIVFAGMAAPSFAGKGEIAYRKTVMKAVGGNMGAMKMILQGKTANKGNLAKHAEAMANLARMTPSLFPKNSSQMDGATEAKDEIWDKPEEFKKVLAAFIKVAEENAKLAKAGKMTGKHLGALGKAACAGCHKPFREKKK